MKRKLVALLVAVLVTLGATAVLAPSAGASSNSGGGITYFCPPALALSDNANISQGGFLGWAVDLDVSAYHAPASGSNCVLGSFWSAVNLTAAFTVQRYVYGVGWETCYYSAQSGSGDVYKAANSTQGTQDAACTSTTWPNGWTVIQWQETGYVSGTGYTWGINSYTTVAA